MGFLDKAKGFFKAAMNSASSSGTVTGGDYARYNVNLSTVNGQTKMTLTMLGKPDVEISKENVKEFTTMETGAKWVTGSGSGQRTCLGNRYKVVMKDGKSFIMNVLANYTSKVEALFIL